MSKQRLTAWFPPHIKPVRVGWYHTGKFYSCPKNNSANESEANWWWNGEFWTGYPCSRDRSYEQNRWWRGLAK